jgi:membrane protein implicated in regulation of membrane protease activity
MYGTFSGMSFGLVIGVAVLVIALAVFASPLLAVGIFIVAAVLLLIGMSALRQRSAKADQTHGGEPGTGPAGPRARGEGAGQATGAPVSGEG